MKTARESTWVSQELSGQKLPHSATYKRFRALTEEVRDRFPDVRALREGQRRELYDLLTSLNASARIRSFPVGNSKIFLYDCTQGLTECHYGRTFIDLLREREFSSGNDRIQPGKTTLVEVSTGSAGIAFGYIAKTLGYDCKIVRPKYMELPRGLLMEEAMQHNEEVGIRGELIPSKYPDFLRGAVRTFRELVQSDAARAERKEGKLALPNHSQISGTVESCRRTAQDACRLLLEQGTDPKTIDALVMAAGNGTSIQGFLEEFRMHNPKVGLYTFEGRAAPNLVNKLPPDIVPWYEPWREERVTLYGADGTQDMEFPAIDALVKEKAITWHWTIDGGAWREEQRCLNSMKPRSEAYGRTTAAAMWVARDFTDPKMLAIAYDLRDRYDQFVTNPDAVCDYKGDFLQKDLW